MNRLDLRLQGLQLGLQLHHPLLRISTQLLRGHGLGRGDVRRGLGGAGAVAAGGFITLMKTLPTIISSFRDSMASTGFVFIDPNPSSCKCSGDGAPAKAPLVQLGEF